MSKDSSLQKKMRKRNQSKGKSKGTRRRTKKSIVFEYQMKSCMTWEYASDFQDIDNWHESLRVNHLDVNIIKTEDLKRERDLCDNFPDDILLGGNQFALKRYCPHDSSLKDPSLTPREDTVEVTQVPPIKVSTKIVHKASSEGQVHPTGSYLTGEIDTFSVEKLSAKAPSSLTRTSKKIASFFDTSCFNENVHRSSLHHKCEDFKIKDKLTTERQSHSNERPFKCTQCPKAFKSKAHLKSHQRFHSGDRPYKCTQCPKAFQTKADLKVHQRTHSGEKPFECTNCGKRFSVSSSLKKHLRTHTGDKPYNCTQCPKMFSQNAHLKKHQLIHSGIKAYKCQQCSKEFSHQTSLTCHLRTHSGIKPFECPHCPQTFANSSNRRQHVLRYHTE